MQKAKVRVLVAHFMYAGNGGLRSVHGDILHWWARTYHEMMKDERVEDIGVMKAGDIPLDMERNKVVAAAIDEGFDIIWMLDSDNIPDLYVGADPKAKPFWKSSFDFVYDRLVQDKPTCICAPYCGPPPHPVDGGEENVYVFYWEGNANERWPGLTIQNYSRQYASQMSGIQPIAAGPTGCVMYSTSSLQLLPVDKYAPEEVMELVARRQITPEMGLRFLNQKSWFYYEHPDSRRTTKASTEDVTNFRDISLAGCENLHEEIVFCNWDSWAGHAKSKIVGKPNPVCVEQVSEHYRRAVENNMHAGVELQDVDFDDNAPVTPSGPVGIEKTNGNPHVIARTVCGIPVRSLIHTTDLRELETLSQLVESKAQQKPEKRLKVIEIGSWVGESALAMTTGFGKEGGEVFCVEHFQGTETDHIKDYLSQAGGSEVVKEYFLLNVADKLDDEIKLIEKPSLEVAKSLTTPAEADIIFIDAEHDYDGCKADIQAWWPHLAKDGWMMGHDYSRMFPGVVQAVDEMFHDIEVRIFDNIWMVARDEVDAARAQEKDVSQKSG